ncbi:multi-sensor signal transduction histidine kinase [Chloroherpeton thalassium ATCC 35110]|uniref:histidine kinase n=1 Tax=Chloroherpeton thalassium (strain ATCC 35110 / GB-78) TaxID=517418 RepID=B3QY92_CHLT3|nr:PAS domain S-box protein [Chloroherpeton thalassium]ACF15058.1 multi-sensor signal transduction histidine kinase [Chloroherpeton thalassium ATCC 35110]
MSLKILYFDSAMLDAQLLETSLKNDGYDFLLTCASRAEKYVSLLKEQPFDVVIAEYHLPSISGEKALSLAKALQPGVPFLFFTNETDKQPIRSLLKKGADDVVFKNHHSRMGLAIEAAFEREHLQFPLDSLRAVSESSYQAFIYIDKSLKIRAFNKFAEELTRKIYRRDISIGDSIFDYALDRKLMQSCIDTALTGKPVLFEKNMSETKGDVAWIAINYMPILDAQNRVAGVCLNAIDISDKKEAQQTLRQVKERNQEIFNQSIVGLYQCSMDGRLTKANPKFAELLGFGSPEEMISCEFRFDDNFYVEPKTREQFLEKLNASGSVSDFISEVRCRDGQKIWISEYARRQRNGETGAPVIEGSVIDVSEQKQTEDSLRKSHDLIISIYKKVDVGICLTNERGDFIETNPALCQLLGYSHDELSQMSFFSMFPKTALEKVKHAHRLVFNQSTESFSHETKCIHKSGLLIDVMITEALMMQADGLRCKITTVSDITERKRTEYALRSVEDRLRTVVANVPVILIATDKEGIYTLVEGKGLQEVGINPRQLIGKSAFDVFKNHKRFLANIVRVLRGEVIHGSMNFYGRYFDTSASPIYNQDGQIVGSISVSFDVTGRRNAEMEKERLQKQLLHSKKIEAIETLSGGVAHEFNNLLAVIAGNAGILRRKLKLDEQLRKYINQIDLATKRAATLTEKLLEFSRQSDFEPKLISINESINSVIVFLEHAADKRIAMTCDLQNDIPKILGDRNQLEQVFLNLAVNACDAMLNAIDFNGTGECHFKTRLIAPKTEDIELYHLEASNKYILVQVSDTGPGIPETCRDKVFEPFFTTKSVGKGTGLGLSIVYGIVNNHQGAIDFESSKEKGTTFNIYLPVPEAALEELKRRPQENY